MTDFNAIVARVVHARAVTDALAATVERKLVELKQAEFELAAVEAELERAIAGAGRAIRETLAPAAPADTDQIREAILAHGGIRKAARALGLPPSTVWEHARRMGMAGTSGRKPRDPK